ncbi:MAG: hypothetical protein ACFFG0_15565 [Candidatus Thorarchaeota archaeon]
MIGYHFTSLKAWKKIQKQGLKPSLNSTNFSNVIKKYSSNGFIWIFNKKLNIHQTLGMILWIIISCRTDNIVLLKIKYKKEQSVKYLYSKDTNGDELKLSHSMWDVGHIGHCDVKMDLLIEIIKPENITLINYWNIKKWLILKSNID